MLKKFSLILLSVLLLCGCSKKDLREEIVFSSWGSVTEVQILKKIINDFENENPNIKVEFLHVPQNYFQKLHLLFVSNTAPDVIFINNLNIPIYCSKLERLDNIVDKSDFFESSVEGLSYEGNLYAVPRDISNLILYVNTDKIKLPDSNWTLEELLSKAKSQTKAGVWGISYEEDVYWALPYLRYYGGGILDDKGELCFKSKESQKGLKFYKDLRSFYKVAPTKSQVGSSTLAQMFLDEKVLMYLSGRWMYPKIKEEANFNWAVINFPNGKSLQYADSSGWALSKESKHKEASIKFIQYLSSEKSSEYFAKTGLVVPARKRIANRLNNEDNNEKIFLEVAEKSINPPINKNYKRLTDDINKEYLDK